MINTLLLTRDVIVPSTVIRFVFVWVSPEAKYGPKDFNYKRGPPPATVHRFTKTIGNASLRAIHQGSL